jgi:chromosome segregation ATPase
MNTTISDHTKLFDEICNKLNELSHRTEADITSMNASSPEAVVVAQAKYEKMQEQMQKFNSELKETQEELKEKIKSLENVHYDPNNLDAQLKSLADQLNNERLTNTKLGSDLAKSLELCLQLQLEIQGIKSRALQIQSEDKKFNHSLSEKNKQLSRDLELNIALKDEMALELAKAKNVFQKEHLVWEEQKETLEQQIQNLKNEKHDLQCKNDEQLLMIQEKENHILSLNQDIEKISSSFSEVEFSAQQQNEVLKNLMGVAENKIIEMKMALDKKNLEAQDYFSHLQQALNHLNVTKQENITLKDYIAKVNHYHQQLQQQQQMQAGHTPAY